MDHEEAVLLTCPMCGDTNLDHDRTSTYDDRDEYEPGNPLGTRGEYTVVRLHCPIGHLSELVTGNHKGAQHVGHYGSLPPRRWPR